MLPLHLLLRISHSHYWLLLLLLLLYWIESVVPHTSSSAHISAEAVEVVVHGSLLLLRLRLLVQRSSVQLLHKQIWRSRTRI